MSCGRNRRRSKLSSILSSQLRHRSDISSRNNTQSKEILRENSTEFERFRILDEHGHDVTPKLITNYLRMSINTYHDDEQSQTDMGSKRIIENRESFISEKSTIGTNNLSTSTSHMARTETYFSMKDKTMLDFGMKFIIESEQLLSRTLQDKISYMSNENNESQAKFLPGRIFSCENVLVNNITLTETETIFILNLESNIISQEDDNKWNKTNERNQIYMKLCQNRSGNDLYMERAMQTFNNLSKTEHIHTDPILTKSQKTWANLWDIHDSLVEANLYKEKIYRQYSMHENENLNDAEMTIDRYRYDNINEKIISNQSSSHNSSTFFSEESIVKMTSSKTNCFQLNDNYQEKLPDIDVDALIMERILNMNRYYKKQMIYQAYKITNRDSYYRFSTIKDNECLYKDDKTMNKYDILSLVRLWHYESSITENRNVSCLCWNQHNYDFLAVGYGKFEYNDDREGLVCCWNSKNPDFPERYYQTNAGVTSLAFSHKRTNLLSVGLFNGNICIFDLNKNSTISMVETKFDKKHSGPVWQLAWIEQDRSSDMVNLEVLVSISSDGRISQWILRKEFEATDLMHLKSYNSLQVDCQILKNSDGNYIDGYLSNFVGGFCFDIRSNDKTIYLCGTDDGLIHRCSTIYNEKYLESYREHSGPVYKVHWSPFAENIFLSASADWTVRLWMIGYSHSCLICSSSNTKAFFDAIWSPKSATMFFCVSENTIEIWDLSKSILDPVYVAHCSEQITLTSIAYATDSDCLLIGTSNGIVWVYHLENLPIPTNANDLISIIRQGISNQN